MADANTVVTSLETLLFDALGDQIDAATKTKITLYSSVVGTLLNQALPVISSTVDWPAIEGGIAQAASGIDAVLAAVRAPVVATSAGVAA